MVAVARYALDPEHNEPPPQLTEAMQCQRWGVLPNGPSLKAQPAGWMHRATVLLNVYDAYQSKDRTDSLSDWVNNYPQHYRLWSKVEEMRRG